MYLVYLIGKWEMWKCWEPTYGEHKLVSWWSKIQDQAQSELTSASSPQLYYIYHCSTIVYAMQFISNGHTINTHVSSNLLLSRHEVMYRTTCYSPNWKRSKWSAKVKKWSAWRYSLHDSTIVQFFHSALVIPYRWSSAKCDDWLDPA
jgi:hypothetical protein